MICGLNNIHYACDSNVLVAPGIMLLLIAFVVTFSLQKLRGRMPLL